MIPNSKDVVRLKVVFNSTQATGNNHSENKISSFTFIKIFFLAKKRFNAQPPELRKFLLLQNDALIDFSSFLTPQPLRKVTLRFYGDVNSNSSTICRCTPNDGNSKIIGSRFINTLFEARGFGGLDLGERGPRV